MASGGTYDETINLLKNHNYYDMKPGQTSIVKQNKIPAILDNDRHLALDRQKIKEQVLSQFPCTCYGGLNL